MNVMNPPEVPELTPARAIRLRRHLMNETRRRRTPLLMPVVAAAVVAAAVGGVAIRSAPPRPAHPPVVLAAQNDPVVFLGKAADAAETRTGLADGKYVYIRSRVSFLGEKADGSTAVTPPHDREIWSPAHVRGLGLLVENGKRTDLDDWRPNSGFADLPADPDALLRLMYDRGKGTGPTPDDEAFTQISDVLVESALPPAVTAGLYRAAAKIPGATMVPDAVDAAGRHGVAVARVEDGVRREWIFDPATYDYLGRREVVLKTGLVVGSTAILTRGFVSGLGVRP